MADVTSPFAFPYPEDTDLVRDGAQDIENLATGVNDYLDGGYLYAGTRYYTSSGTFAKADPLGTGDIGLRAIRVRMVAGGGAGGGISASFPSGGGGGGGGAYAEKFLLASVLDASEVVTRGAGGVGSTGAGTSGGRSEFALSKAYEVSASGGIGAVTETGAEGNSNTIGADLSIGGSGGGAGRVGDPGNGAGGGSHLGGGGRGYSSFSTNTAGEAGRIYGGGGSGARAASASTAGGSGANGIVIIDCFV